MGDASVVENSVNYEDFLPGRGATGDGAATHELSKLTHARSPYCIELTASITL
jgi:hypothetical protein